MSVPVKAAGGPYGIPAHPGLTRTPPATPAKLCGFVVWGTGSGSSRDPGWFRNLRKAKVAEVHGRAKRLQVQPHELVGGERQAMWNHVVLAQAPEVDGSCVVREPHRADLRQPDSGLLELPRHWSEPRGQRRLR